MLVSLLPMLNMTLVIHPEPLTLREALPRQQVRLLRRGLLQLLSSSPHPPDYQWAPPTASTDRRLF